MQYLLSRCSQPLGDSPTHKTSADHIYKSTETQTNNIMAEGSLETPGGNHGRLPGGKFSDFETEDLAKRGCVQRQ